MHEWNNPKECELVKKYAPSKGCDRASIVIPLPKSQKDCLMRSLFYRAYAPAGAIALQRDSGGIQKVLDELDGVDVSEAEL